MRSLGLLLVIILAVGCNKKPKEVPPDTAPPPAPTPSPAPKPAPYVSSGGGPTAPNQSGNLTVTGGQGAVQSTRLAAARLVNLEQLKQLHLSMFQTWSLDNRVPTVNEIMQEARMNSQLLPLLKEEVVILTGTTRGEHVWAYTQFPQRAGEHYVITRSGVEQIAPEELKKRLESENAPVKLSK